LSAALVLDDAHAAENDVADYWSLVLDPQP